MSQRLPLLAPVHSDRYGVVYVVQRGPLCKIGFSRNRVERRTRDAEGALLFTIPAGQQPCVLEHLIHQRFAAKRADETWGREWFSLNDDDLHWLRGLAATIADEHH